MIIFLSVAIVGYSKYRTTINSRNVHFEANLNALTTGGNVFPVTRKCRGELLYVCSRKCRQCQTEWIPSVSARGPAYDVSGMCDVCGSIFLF